MRPESPHAVKGGLWKKAKGAVGFSSTSGDWDTPQAFYDKL